MFDKLCSRFFLWMMMGDLKKAKKEGVPKEMLEIIQQGIEHHQSIIKG